MKRVLVVMLGLVIGSAVVYSVLPAILFMLFHTDEVEHDHLFTSRKPVMVGRLELSDEAGVVVWEILNTDRRPVTAIDYASTPPGWNQRIPKIGNPRELKRKERLLLALSYPPDGWARIAIRAVGGPSFKHGLATWGRGCKQPECAEIFTLRAAPAN